MSKYTFLYTYISSPKVSKELMLIPLKRILLFWSTEFTGLFGFGKQFLKVISLSSKTTVPFGEGGFITNLIWQVRPPPKGMWRSPGSQIHQCHPLKEIAGLIKGIFNNHWLSLTWNSHEWKHLVLDPPPRFFPQENIARKSHLRTQDFSIDLMTTQHSTC